MNDAPKRTWQEIQEWSKKFDGQLSTADIRRLFEIIAALEQERKKLRLKARAVDRLPFCPDHRDKVHGRPCRECELTRLREAIEKEIVELEAIDSPYDRALVRRLRQLIGEK